MSDANALPFLRLFIAIAVPLNVRNEIRRVQDQLRRSAPPDAVRWTRPHQYHVTLKFLGDVPSPQLSALEHSVSKVCSNCPALRLSAHGIGFFPGAQKPRVIWMGAGDNDGQFSELHRRLDEVLQPFAPTEKRPGFAGHIALGRFKPGRRARSGNCGNAPRCLIAGTSATGRPGKWKLSVAN